MNNRILTNEKIKAINEHAERNGQEITKACDEIRATLKADSVNYLKASKAFEVMSNNLHENYENDFFK